MLQKSHSFETYVFTVLIDNQKVRIRLINEGRFQN